MLPPNRPLQDTPNCSLNKKHGSEVTNNPNKYKAIEVGELAYLWVPSGYNSNTVKELIISAHARTNEFAFPGESSIDIRPVKFVAPDGCSILFYAEQNNKLFLTSLFEFYHAKSCFSPCEVVNGGDYCLDYILKKGTSSQYTQRAGVSYSSIQDLMDNTEQKTKEWLKQYYDILDESKADIEKKILRFESHVEECLKNISKRESDIIFFNNCLKIENSANKTKEFFESQLSSVKNKLTYWHNIYDIVKSQRKEDQKTLEFLQLKYKKLKEIAEKDVNNYSAILTIRNRSNKSMPKAKLSNLILQLYSMGYNFKKIHCLTCRVSATTLLSGEEPKINHLVLKK